MKIGILTYHRSINYGAVMQAYALSRRISELEDCEVEIIDYMSRRMDIYYKLFTLYRGKNSLFRLFDRIKMYVSFSKSINALPLSDSKLVSDDLEKFHQYIKGKYDVIVVGSDAVWNYEKRGLPNPYFLPYSDIKHKLSYAASCNGISLRDFTEDKKSTIGSYLKEFEYIGVRDQLTESVANGSTGLNVAIHNCDPTFLLDFEKDNLGDDLVKNLIVKLKKYGWDENKKHIGLMLSNKNGDLAKELVRKIKERYGDTYQIVAVYSYCKYADIKYISDLTPFEWSRIFSLFDITFSKYFHGTLLSIKNNTPVISLSAESEMEGIPAKVEDVLARLNLTEFYFPAKSKEDIDWNILMNRVNSLLENPPKIKMKNSIEKEEVASETFFEHLKQLSQKEKNV